MKRIYLKLFVVIAVLGINVNIYSQETITNLMKAGVADLNTLAERYLEPMGTGFAANLGSNWYNTAAPHKLLGFDITVGGGIAMAPTSAQSFSLTGFKNLQPLATGGGAVPKTAPTFAAKTGTKGVMLGLKQPANITVNGTTIPNPVLTDGNPSNDYIVNFESPQGVFNAVPGVNAQLAIGLPFRTELAFRFVPTVKAKGFDLGLWGIGIKHDFMQWVPVLKALPFDASIFLGYTKFTMNYAFPVSAQITPGDLVSGSVGYIPESGVSFNDQKLGMSASAFTGNILVSKKLLFFTPYIGFGLTSSKFNLGFKGNYPMLGDPYMPTTTVGGTVVPNLTDPNYGKFQMKHMENPIDLTYNNTMVNFTAGFRLKILWVLALHAQYTFQKYPIASMGFGINIR